MNDSSRSSIMGSLRNKLLQSFSELMPKAIVNQIILNHNKNKANQIISYSQEGEDLLLQQLLDTSKPGFYVDIGAHHPTRISNTHALYLKGWRGINIDATPGCMQVFNQVRKNDINIEIAIAQDANPMVFYLFDEPALNTFDAKKAEKIITESSFKLLDKKVIQTKRLEEVLDQYLPTNQLIDFMNIDVECFEIQVLKSNNWQKYKPTILLVENIQYDLEAVLNSELTKYLNQLGYSPIAKGLRSVFYRLNLALKH